MILIFYLPKFSKMTHNLDLPKVSKMTHNLDLPKVSKMTHKLDLYKVSKMIHDLDLPKDRKLSSLRQSALKSSYLRSNHSAIPKTNKHKENFFCS